MPSFNRDKPNTFAVKEQIGLFPRSFSRVFDRFSKQFFFDREAIETLVLSEYRFYRYLFLTTIKCIFILVFFPVLVNLISKTYLIRPLTTYFYNKQNEIFLNAYQTKHAFTELQNEEEKLFFEALTLPPPPSLVTKQIPQYKKWGPLPFSLEEEGIKKEKKNDTSSPSLDMQKGGLHTEGSSPKKVIGQQSLQKKTIELAICYNNQSIESIVNFFADLLSFITLCFLLMSLEISIKITKSFLFEIFFSLDDSKKSLLILLVTDLLVGYHSPNLWELLFQFLFNHYGLPESQTGIFLLVASIPVLLDVLFKYLIFRHLNRASPATVATYHAMIE